MEKNEQFIQAKEVLKNNIITFIDKLTTSKNEKNAEKLKKNIQKILK